MAPPCPYPGAFRVPVPTVLQDTWGTPHPSVPMSAPPVRPPRSAQGSWLCPRCPAVCPLPDTPLGPAVSPPQWTAFPDVLSLRFRWDGYSKSRGSLLVGSSPEFDLALFTLCFLTRPDRQ